MNDSIKHYCFAYIVVRQCQRLQREQLIKRGLLRMLKIYSFYSYYSFFFSFIRYNGKSSGDIL